MGNFHSKPDRRSGFRKDRGSGGSFGGESRGFGGRPRSRGARRFGSENREMHEATCDKCGKQCSIPFRPSGGKPVYCSNCFRSNGGDSRGNESRQSFAPRSERPVQANGISQEQFKQLNTKLDKILALLEQLEIEVIEDDEDEDDSEDDEK
ncbi:hypothetical protein FJZ18_03985 [Candidatus Pacearchaeota archaeon]|nr:hypothetical protein [Candidatus Pacearchaeota archaeon]